MVCDAYEEFLITKKVPQGLEEIGRMAVEYQERKAREKAEKEKSEQEKLLELLQKADRNTAVKAAAEFMTMAGAE